ncbi:MAG TPA: GTPase domain-containing protein, partial [Polyangiales bacterium]|nr:GTPase domain-containing protein [Polyangiales bacterium]
DSIPFVLQYNKRDMPGIAPLEELRQMLNPNNVPDFEAIAPNGTGVFDTLKAVAKLVLTELRKAGG